MDIKRVAFETRPVKSVRPAVASRGVPDAVRLVTVPAREREQAVAGGKINREEIAAIVDRFLADKRPDMQPSPSPLPRPFIESEAGSMYAEQPGGGAERHPRMSNGVQRIPQPAGRPAATASGECHQALHFCR